MSTQAETQQRRLPFWTKLIFGSGDWSISSFGTLRQIFYAIFLTDVVGLEPRLASIAALCGIIWDAINDPLVGLLSDRVRTRWGRRRPFLLFFAIPFVMVTASGRPATRRDTVPGTSVSPSGSPVW